MYQFISIFDHIRFFLFKHTLTSFNFFFGLINTHIFYLIQVILVVVNFQKFWGLMIDSTYLFGFNHVELIHHVVNNSMVLLFFLKPSSRCGIAPTVLCRMGCSVLSSKFSQDLTFIIRMSRAMDNIVFYALFERST